MSTIERTAYPRYSNRRRMKPSELEEYYTLSTSEVSLMNKYARGDKYRLNFAIQLKKFQNLGYFIAFDEVPDEIINHIRKQQNFTTGKAMVMSVLRMITPSRYTCMDAYQTLLYSMYFLIY
jgi:hypothetical protein